MAFDRNAEEDLAYGHKPVLLDECLTGLNIRPDGIYVDGTLGRAGHSLEIARRLSGGGRLICLDRDETAIAAARERHRHAVAELPHVAMSLTRGDPAIPTEYR